MNTQYREEDKSVPVSEKLKALFELQTVASEIDKIKTLRGELPLEVQDLEDDITGLKTRVSNFDDDVRNLETSIQNRKAAIKESEALITKYTEQQNNVRNNREYDSLNKEIEFQKLEIELSEKRIREFTAEMKTKSETIESSKTQLSEREEDLDRKKKEGGGKRRRGTNERQMRKIKKKEKGSSHHLHLV